MNRKQMQGFCTNPDRHNPELICGYPLPCPYHTVVIEVESDPPRIIIPATIPKAADPEILNKLKEIAGILKK